MLNLAMRIERERHVGAQAYERSPERSGYANGYKAKKIDTLAGTLTVEVPKSRGGDTPFYPQALERGRRSCRAVMLAIAQMYIQGVSTRDVEKVMAEFGLESLSSAQVSRATALMDAELEAWRTRQLRAFPYLFLDARYEKVRIDGVVRDAAILSAIGIDEDGKRCVLGISIALSEAEVHWRSFLDSLVARGLRGVRFITSDDHAGLVAARKAVFPGAVWQRCQFHLARNAIHHAPQRYRKKRHRPPAARRLERHGPRQCRGRTRPHRQGICRRRAEARHVARTHHPRGSRGVLAARGPLAAHAHRQSHRTYHPAGTQTAHPKGPRLPQRGRPRTPRNRHPR
jgi:putative transposase